MAQENWKLLRREKPVDLKLFDARYDWYTNKRNGKEVKMVALDAKDAVNVVALTTEGKFVMVRQFRFGMEQETIELPGGLVDEGESPLEAAQRELREETGFTSGEWEFLHSVQSNPVFMNSIQYHYLAKGVKKTSELELDDGENIEVLELDEEEIKLAYREGLIRHPLIITGLTKVLDLWEKIDI